MEKCLKNKASSEALSGHGLIVVESVMCNGLRNLPTMLEHHHRL